MDDEGPGCGAIGEAVVVLRVFEDLPDPRQRAKVVRPRDEILLLCLPAVLLAVLAGAGTITDMARSGEKKRVFLRCFRPSADGTPTHDHLGDIPTPPLHMVPAFAARRRLVLGQVAAADTSNAVVAIPEWLDTMATEGAAVTIDAMGCRRETARKSLDTDAGHVRAFISSP